MLAHRWFSESWRGGCVRAYLFHRCCYQPAQQKNIIIVLHFCYVLSAGLVSHCYFSLKRAFCIFHRHRHEEIYLSVSLPVGLVYFLFCYMKKSRLWPKYQQKLHLWISRFKSCTFLFRVWCFFYPVPRIMLYFFAKAIFAYTYLVKTLEYFITELNVQHSAFDFHKKRVKCRGAWTYSATWGNAFNLPLFFNVMPSFASNIPLFRTFTRRSANVDTTLKSAHWHYAN